MRPPPLTLHLIWLCPSTASPLSSHPALDLAVPLHRLPHQGSRAGMHAVEHREVELSGGGRQGAQAVVQAEQAGKDADLGVLEPAGGGVGRRGEEGSALGRERGRQANAGTTSEAVMNIR